jgi:hypothetical protein
VLRYVASLLAVLLYSPTAAPAQEKKPSKPDLVVVGRIVDELVWWEAPRKEDEPGRFVRRLLIRIHRVDKGSIASRVVEAQIVLPANVAGPAPPPSTVLPPMSGGFTKPVFALWKVSLIRVEGDPLCSAEPAPVGEPSVSVVPPEAINKERVPCYRVLPGGLQSVTELEPEAPRRRTASYFTELKDQRVAVL